MGRQIIFMNNYPQNIYDYLYEYTTHIGILFSFFNKFVWSSNDDNEENYPNKLPPFYQKRIPFIVSISGR